MKTHCSLFLIFAIFTFPQGLKPSSCSSTQNASSTSASTYSNNFLTTLTSDQQQALASAIQQSITESYQQNPHENTEARFKRTLNNPKVLNTLGIIRQQVRRTNGQIAYDTLSTELDVLTSTIIREQLSHTTTCSSSNSTSSSAPSSISSENSYTQLAAQLYELSLNEQNFNAIVTPFLLLEKDGKIHRSFAPVFNLLIPTRHNYISNTCAIDKTNTLVATGDYKGNVQIRELISGKRLMINNGKEFFSAANPDSVTCLAFSPDSKTIAVGTQTGHITLWSLVSGKQLTQRHSHAAVLSLQIDPVGPTITTTHFGNSIERWNLQTNVLTTGGFQNSRLLAISNDGERFAIVLGQETLIQDSSTNEIITRLNTGAITMGKFSSHGDQFLAVSQDAQALNVWNLATGEIQSHLDNKERPCQITSFTRAQEADIIGIRWNNGVIYIVDLANAAIEGFNTEVDTPIIALSANGQKIAFVNINNTICVVTRIANSFKMSYEHQLPLEQGVITDCSLSADGNYLVAIHSQQGQETNNLFIHMFDEPAYKLLKNCSPCALELIENLIATTMRAEPILTPEEKVQLTPYESILFRSVPDFIKHVLLRTNKILITKPQDGAPEKKEEKQESKEQKVTTLKRS